MSTSLIHDFHERLAFSEAAGTEPFWDAVYRKAFPTLVGHMQTTGATASQRAGIDRVIHLANGKTLYVDEKKRERDYADILLEYVSNDRTGAPGWIEKDLAIDYLAYAFMPSQRCYLFPWLILRRAWIGFGAKWKEQYKPVKAQNNTYATWSIPVPILVLRRAVSTAMIIDVDVLPHESTIPF
jgi:hypothetical protein